MQDRIGLWLRSWRTVYVGQHEEAADRPDAGTVLGFDGHKIRSMLSAIRGGAKGKLRSRFMHSRSWDYPGARLGVGDRSHLWTRQQGGLYRAQHRRNREDQ